MKHLPSFESSSKKVVDFITARKVLLELNRNWIQHLSKLFQGLLHITVEVVPLHITVLQTSFVGKCIHQSFGRGGFLLNIPFLPSQPMLDKSSSMSKVSIK
jgi:hypothetical protein